MSRRQWRLSGLIISVACAVSASFVIGASRGRAIENPPVEGCSFAIGERNLVRADRPARPVRLPSSGTVVVSGSDGLTTTAAALDATLAPDLPKRAVWHVRERHFNPPTTTYELALDMDDVASYGVGLNVITVTTDHCAVTAWVRLGGRPPVFTALGVGGFSAAVFGVIAVIVNLWRSGAGGSATFPGALGGGIPLGVGTALLVQQMGIVPATRATAIAWVVLASSGAASLHVLRRMDSLRRANRGVDDGVLQTE